MAAHLPGLLQAAGASATAAIAAASLVGPAQVGARIVEFRLLRSFHPISSARLASALHPIGAAFLVAFGAPGIIAFALLHGAGNGMITIAKGTLPLALFGPGGTGCAAVCCRHRPGCCKRQRRFCLACYSTGSGSARSDYRLGCASPPSARCFCCGRARAVAAHPSPVRGSGANRWTTLLSRRSPPPTVGRLAEAKLNATDRLSPRKWRVLSAVFRSDNEAEQIVKSEGCAALQFSAYPTYPDGGCRGRKSCDRVGAG